MKSKKPKISNIFIALFLVFAMSCETMTIVTGLIDDSDSAVRETNPPDEAALEQLQIVSDHARDIRQKIIEANIPNSSVNDWLIANSIYTQTTRLENTDTLRDTEESIVRYNIAVGVLENLYLKVQDNSTVEIAVINEELDLFWYADENPPERIGTNGHYSSTLVAQLNNIETHIEGPVPEPRRGLANSTRAEQANNDTREDGRGVFISDNTLSREERREALIAGREVTNTTGSSIGLVSQDSTQADTDALPLSSRPRESIRTHSAEASEQQTEPLIQHPMTGIEPEIIQQTTIEETPVQQPATRRQARSQTEQTQTVQIQETEQVTQQTTTAIQTTTQQPVASQQTTAAIQTTTQQPVEPLQTTVVQQQTTIEETTVQQQTIAQQTAVQQQTAQPQQQTAQQAPASHVTAQPQSAPSHEPAPQSNLMQQHAAAMAASTPIQATAVSHPAQYRVISWELYRDCLWNIAERVYNDPKKWRIIYEANKHIMPDPDNPDLIVPDMILEIPSIAGEHRSGLWDGSMGSAYLAVTKKEDE